MPTLEQVAALLLTHPGVLPGGARRVVIDAAHGDVSATLAAAALRRPEFTAAESDELRTCGASTEDRQAAWLARPEHDLPDLPDMVVVAASHWGSAGVARIVTRLLSEPLCRSEVVDVLAASPNPLVTAAVANTPGVPAQVRDVALARTDELLTPDPASPPRACPVYVVDTVGEAFARLGAEDQAAVTSWCWKLRTVALRVAAAAALTHPDNATAQHVIDAAVLPELTRGFNHKVAERIYAAVTATLPQLSARRRAEVADAIEANKNGRTWSDLRKLAVMLRVTDAATQPLTDVVAAADGAGAHHRRAAAGHLLTVLGDNPDAWRVLRASLPHVRADATVAELAAVAAGVARPPAR